MLVLTRRTYESIRIGDEITVTIVRIGADKVRLGIEAPRELPIVRGELEAEAELNRGDAEIAETVELSLQSTAETPRAQR